MKTQYRSLQQIAAKNLTAKIDALIADVEAFHAMTAPNADSVEKLRKVQRRIADHMHKDDRKGADQ